MDKKYEFGKHQQFESFISLKEWIGEMEKKLQQKFALLRSKKIVAAKLKKEISNDLVYYTLHYVCKYSGDGSKSKGRNIRQRSSCKTGCPAFFKFATSADGRFLQMKDYSEEHQHERMKVEENSNSIPQNVEVAGNSKAKDDSSKSATIKDVMAIAAIENIDEQWNEIEKAFANTSRPVAVNESSGNAVKSQIVDEKAFPNTSQPVAVNESSGNAVTSQIVDDKAFANTSRPVAVTESSGNAVKCQTVDEQQQPVSNVSTENFTEMDKAKKRSTATEVLQPQNVNARCVDEKQQEVAYVPIVPNENTGNVSELTLPEKESSDFAEDEKVEPQAKRLKASQVLGQIAFQSSDRILSPFIDNAVANDNQDTSVTTAKSDVNIDPIDTRNEQAGTKLIFDRSADTQSVKKDKIVSTELSDNTSTSNVRSAKVDLFCVKTHDGGSKQHHTAVDNKTKLESLGMKLSTRSRGRPRGSGLTAIGLPRNRGPTSFTEKSDAEKLKYILSQVIDTQLIGSVMDNEYKVTTALLAKWETTPISEAIVNSSVDIYMLKPYFEDEAFVKLLNMVQLKKKEDRVTCYTCRQVAESNRIICNSCLHWVHFKCASLKRAPKTKYWFCSRCKNRQ